MKDRYNNIFYHGAERTFIYDCDRKESGELVRLFSSTDGLYVIPEGRIKDILNKDLESVVSDKKWKKK